MNVLPVITREVREQARQNFTYSLRMLGVAAVLAALLLVVLDRGLPPGSGGRVFTGIHVALLLAIWLLVPLSASDTLSRERREGTLGLLFLTPLGAADIVFAKVAAHGLRALGLWLACVPVVTIPILIGGLSWQAVALSCVINFNSLALSLAASVLASSVCRTRHRALALTMVMSFVLAAFLGMALLAVVGVMVAGNFGPGWYRLFSSRMPPLEMLVQGAFLMLTGQEQLWSLATGMFSMPSRHNAWIGVGLVTMLALALAWLLIRVAARQIRRRWREESRSARVERLERVFCTPVLGQSLLRQWMRWKLQHNPIGWLEQRRWSGRLVMWSWLAVLVSLYSSVLSSGVMFSRGFADLQELLGWLLLASVATTAAGSFRRERESGVLELLLVTPLSAWRIIGGRLRGVWSQFAPAVLLLVGVWLFVATFTPGVRAGEAVWFSIGFLTVPVVGLYYSLARTHFLSAFLWTILLGCGFPTLLVLGIRWQLRLRQMGGPSPVGADSAGGLEGPVWGLTQLAMALAFAWLLHHNLNQRRFALERRGG